MRTIIKSKIALIVGGLGVTGCLLAAFVPWNVSAQSGQQEHAGDRATQRATQNERIYGYNGVITGRVTFADGKPAAGFRVVARFVMHQTGAPSEGEAITDADGRYEIRGLNPQGFYVRVENDGKPYVVPPPRRVDLKNRAENIDFVLRLGPQITVRVRDAETGRPVPGMIVEASSFASPQPVGVTNKWGEFQFRAGQLETHLRLRAPDDRPPKVAAAPGYSFYHVVRLKQVQPFTWDVRTYENPYQRAPRTFQGTVLGPGDVPVAGALVRMIRYNDINRTMTDAAGRFIFHTERMTEHEHKTSGVILRADKDDLSALNFPKASETWGNIVLRLEPVQKPSLYGVVTDFEGRPLEGVPITYSESFPRSSALFTVQPSNGGATDAGGRFVISELSPDASYRLRFGGTPQFGIGRRTFGTVTFPQKGTSGTVQLRPGEQRDIGRIIMAEADTVIAGQVVDKEGKPVPGKRGADKKEKTAPMNLMVLIRGQYTDVHAYPDADGRFKAEHIVREPLTLNIYFSEDGFFRTGPDSPDHVYSMPVRAGDGRVQVVLPERKPHKQ